MFKRPAPPVEEPKVEGERHVSDVTPLANPARKKLALTLFATAGALAVGVMFFGAAMEPKNKGEKGAKTAPLAVNKAARPFEMSKAPEVDPNEIGRAHV